MTCLQTPWILIPLGLARVDELEPIQEEEEEEEAVYNHQAWWHEDFYYGFAQQPLYFGTDWQTINEIEQAAWNPWVSWNWQDEECVPQQAVEIHTGAYGGKDDTASRASFSCLTATRDPLLWSTVAGECEEFGGEDFVRRSLEDQ